MVRRRGVRGEAYSQESTRQVGKRSWWTRVADARYVPVYNIIEIIMIEPSHDQTQSADFWKPELED